MSAIVQMIWEEGADQSFGLPQYETDAAAGVDLRANFEEVLRDVGVILDKGERALIPTGLRMALPNGYEAQIRPRSGLALKHGISLVNSPGTIDADYRGELKVLLVNLSDSPFVIEHGERIAQMVVAKHEHVIWNETKSLETTERGAGGFGHTGVE